jgi:hypothetical protein
MNLHTIAVLFILLGLAGMVYCLVEAEVCSRQVARYLAQQATQRAAREETAGETRARDRQRTA